MGAQWSSNLVCVTLNLTMMNGLVLVLFISSVTSEALPGYSASPEILTPHESGRILHSIGPVPQTYFSPDPCYETRCDTEYDEFCISLTDCNVQPRQVCRDVQVPCYHPPPRPTYPRPAQYTTPSTSIIRRPRRTTAKPIFVDHGDTITLHKKKTAGAAIAIGGGALLLGLLANAAGNIHHVQIGRR